MHSYQLISDPNPPDPRLQLLEWSQAKRLLRHARRTPGYELPTGIAFPVRLRWRVGGIKNVVFRDANFRGPMLTAWPFTTGITACLFQDVLFDGPYVRKAQFTIQGGGE